MLEGIILFVILVYAISEIFHRKERKDLMNRIMSRHFEEYKYYEKKYIKDLREVDTLRKDARKEQVKEPELPSEEEIKEGKAYDEFTRGLEQEWSKEELDMKKVTQIIEKEK